MPKRGDSALYALEPEPVIKVLQVCSTLEERIIVGVPLFLGLRVGELVHMCADWLTSDGNLSIPMSQPCGCTDCVKKKGGVWKPKTGAGVRTVPISRPIQKDLLRFLAMQPKGLQVSRIRIWYWTKDILKRAGVKQKGLAGSTIYPHALRATCASMLAAGGMSAANLAYFMGWSSIAVGDHYVKLAQAKQGAMAQARNIFG